MSFASILRMALQAVCWSGIAALLATIVSSCFIKKKSRRCLLFWWIWYLGALGYVTLLRYGLDMRIQFAGNMETVNLMPIVSTIKLLEHGSVLLFVYNIAGNLLWFVPMGILLGISVSKLKLFQVFLIGALVSGGIECIQFLLQIGTSDIDDVLFNMIGAGCGYLLYHAIQRVYQSYKRNTLKQG